MYLLELLKSLSDKRRDQSKQYALEFIILFTIFTVLAGGDSYRDVERFIKSHFKLLKWKFKLKWRQPPSFVTIRSVLLSLNIGEFEEVFRKHAKFLAEKKGIKGDSIAIDGKALRGSYDNDKGAPFIQLLTGFLTQAKLILGHEFIEDNKTNEIPKAQKLIKEIEFVDTIFTADALHCQKKNLGSSKGNKKFRNSSSKIKPKRIIKSDYRDYRKRRTPRNLRHMKRKIKR